MRRASRLAVEGRTKLAVAAVGALALFAVAAPLGPIAAAAAGSGVTKGTPWTGPRGVKETVGRIMARGATATARREAPPVRHGPTLIPSSGAIAGGSSASGPAPALQPRAPQSVTTNFLGGTLGESGFVPPDSMGAAGPTQFLVGINGLIRTFDKNTGVADGTLNTTADNFFSSVRGTNFTSDPRVRYDRLSGRWFVTMITVNPNAGALQPANQLVLAVSSGSAISSISSFTFFSFQQDAVTPVGIDAGCFLDYDTLGVDVNALYVGGNMFCVSGQQSVYTDSSLWVIRKSSVLGMGPMVVTVFRNLTNGTSQGPFTPQGADNEDPVASFGYIIGHDVHFFSHLMLRRVSDPGGTPSISGNLDIPVATTTQPILVPHLNSDGRLLDSVDLRLMNAVVRGGSLWTNHNIQVDSSGNGSKSGGRNGTRWYQIDVLNPTPTVTQSGTVFDPATTNPLSYWMPSINVSAQGHVAMGGSVAGAAHYVDAWTAGRLSSDPLDSSQAPFLYTSSNAAYNPIFQGFPDNPHRWGDYSFTSLDPDDGMTMWTIQEYTNAANSWGVQVAKLMAPPPLAPTLSDPVSIPVGLASVNVAIRGGAAFFDPGPGYAKHISASVGGGVVVNSVRYDNPAQVVLNLNTTSASVGAQSVTITNPDGQSAMQSGLLNLTPAEGQLRVTTNPALPSQILLNGVPRDSWGLNWLGLPAGSYTLSFTHVEGFSEPAPQTVTVTAGSTTVASGNFTQRASLRVITNPAVPGAISVDGVTHNDWGMWTDLDVGTNPHTVCFGPVANFAPPPCQQLTLTAGSLSTVTGNYTSSPGAPGLTGTGLLRVTTNPALPSQILLNGVPMDSWGLNWVDLAPGSYMLSFTHVEGFTEPAPQTVVVTAGNTTVVQGNFTQRGSLRAITSPAEPATITVDGVPRNNWGMWTDLPVGPTNLCFGWAPQAVAPPGSCTGVLVSPGTLTTVTGVYTPGP
jgi:hypothetical protein